MTVTRFAPSPTGLLHIGNARSAILSYLTSKKYGLKFLLRIDDTDKIRSQDKYVKMLKEDLEHLGINWDYTFKQSDMQGRYKSMMQACIAADLVYPVWDTEHSLEELRKELRARRKSPAYKRHHASKGDGEPYWRFDLGSTKIIFEDLIAGRVEIGLESISDPVICKTDGEFTYTFASIIDDLFEDVSYIVRGADHLTNTAVQLCIADKIKEAKLINNSTTINFAHYPLFSESGDKMSKRLNSFSIRNMQEIHPLAMAHYLVSVGYKKDLAVELDLTSLAKEFDLKSYSSSSIIEYSQEDLLRWQHQVFRGSDYSLVEKFFPVELVEAWGILRETIITKDDAQRWYRILNEEVNFVSPINEVEIDPKNPIESAKQSKNGLLFLRHILTGLPNGPKLSDLVKLIPQNIIEYRIQNNFNLRIKFYNSTSRKKELFVPNKMQRVEIYCCGPTVYSKPHIGNIRTCVAFDILYRFISHFYHTIYVRNVTDIDDKIIEKSINERKPPSTIANLAYNDFTDDIQKLNLLKPTFEPLVTKSIPEIINVIKQIMEKGFGYLIEDGVYFDISKIKNMMNYNLFGCIDETGSDFTLWKFRKPTEIGWDSPWGWGRPGWHIECTAMAAGIFQFPFDIHCGGRDLIFPHHTNECAQGYALYGCETANYWLHSNLVNIENIKMSKSLHNEIYISNLKLHPMIIRLALSMTHYRQEVPWSDQMIIESKTLYNKWRRQLGQKSELMGGVPLPEFLNVLADDLNVPLAIRILDGAFEEKKACDIIASFKLIGIEFNFDYLNDESIRFMVESRQKARANSNFIEADRIRDELLNKNIQIEEYKNHYTWYEIV